jgi:hypothetical protein
MLHTRQPDVFRLPLEALFAFGCSIVKPCVADGNKSFSWPFQKLSEEETATIDKICKEEANALILFDPDVVKGLYQRGLIYFDVPVYPDDRFKGKLFVF